MLRSLGGWETHTLLRILGEKQRGWTFNAGEEGRRGEESLFIYFFY